MSPSSAVARPVPPTRRVLSERSPHTRVALFEVGPLLAEPPGIHVKNIADPSERTRAQRKSEGPFPHTVVAGDPVPHQYSDPDKRVVRPGTALLPEGYQAPGEDGLPAAAMSSNVGGMGAHWTGACPRPGVQVEVGALFQPLRFQQPPSATNSLRRSSALVIASIACLSVGPGVT